MNGVNDDDDAEDDEAKDDGTEEDDDNKSGREVVEARSSHCFILWSKLHSLKSSTEIAWFSVEKHFFTDEVIISDLDL